MLQIIVYVDPLQTEKQKHVIELLDRYYTVLVDAVHGKDTMYLRKNFVHSHRFFFVSEFLSMCTSDELDIIAPDFVIAFQETIQVTEKQWVMIERYVESLFFPNNSIDGSIILAAQNLLAPKQKTTPHVAPLAPTTLHKNEFYNLVCREVKDKNIMLIQVDKPFCDLPYTVVIRDYTNKGLKSFFTDLFICQSWGVCRKDYAFLKQVWTQWNMDGDFDLDGMLLAATKRCFPTENGIPEPEPEVYRRSIDEVLVGFEKRELGCQHYMGDYWNEQRMRKRRREDEILLN